MEPNIKIISGVTLTGSALPLAASMVISRSFPESRPDHTHFWSNIPAMFPYMHKTFRHVVVAVTFALAVNPSFAGNGVDPATIAYKDWGDAKPKTLVILPQIPQVNKALQLFGSWKGEFEWRGSDELTQIGNDLLKRNHFEAYGNGKFVTRVTELYLGVPEGLLKVLRYASSNHQLLTVADVRNVPIGATKVIYISTNNLITFTPEGIEAIVVAFEDVSDADLRRVAFEEAVLRQLRYRED